MAKQLTSQRFILKIHSSRLRKSKWKLSLSLDEARRNDELVSLASSQILRWIDELNGDADAEERAVAIRRDIRRIRHEPYSLQNKKAIRQLYAELDEAQYKPDYICVIMDRAKDYKRACAGFTINGIRYRRLLGTNGGVKTSTIVFVSERLAPELRRRIENGRDAAKPLVPAKLEAYKSLVCSGSTPVSMPHGVIVVDDCETEFFDDIVYLNDEADGEPTMEDRKHEKIVLNESDGYGLMLPSLAERWAEELKLDYRPSAVNTRFSFEKGVVFCFDFVEFAEKIAGSYFVKDAWGTMRDVREAELVLTTSMLKLWDSYESLEAYLSCCEENHYTFAVTKTAPKELERERDLNYQFIQSYDLTDEDVDKLIAPTMDLFNDILHADYRKTALFLRGGAFGDDFFDSADASYVKAMLIEPKILNDPHIQNNIYQAIRNRIDQAKIGVIRVHGNYSIISGDPYALCQHMFGLEVTGLMKAGEIYNRYWLDAGAETLACFRAPMTCANNIKIVRVCRSEEAQYWFRYMTATTSLNCWDTITHALNGADKDGDIVMLTDNEVLVGKAKTLPTLMCVQRKATKILPEEEDFVKANLDSFGNDIGRITNYVTSMYDVKTRFPEGSREREILDYRIMCGQLFQQNAIKLFVASRSNA